MTYSDTVVTRGKPNWRMWLITGLIVASGLGVYIWHSRVSHSQKTTQLTEKVVPKIQTITALGYLEPRGRVIKLSAPTSSGGNSRLEKLLVKEGDSVKTGQLIAILDSHDRLQAALTEAKEQVKVAQSNLAVIKAGAKQGEVKAQQAEISRLQAQRQGDMQAQFATIARLQAELQNAQAEAERYNLLYQEGAVSASLRDSKNLTLATTQSNLQEAQAVLERIKNTQRPELTTAKATLNRIAEVRPVDVAAAQSQVERSIATVEQAKAELALASVYAPQAGQVLYINTRPGELISSEGILELGRTNQMTALLEVYETDISKVKIGQVVKLFVDSHPESLFGKVSEIGLKVKRQNVVNSDTSGNIDARIVEIRVQLEPTSVQKVVRLTNLQVTGEIQL